MKKVFIVLMVFLAFGVLSAQTRTKVKDLPDRVLSDIAGDDYYTLQWDSSGTRVWAKIDMDSLLSVIGDSLGGGSGDVTLSGDNAMTGRNTYADLTTFNDSVSIASTSATTMLFVDTSPNGINGPYYGTRSRMRGASTGAYSGYAVIGTNAMTNATGTNYGVYGGAEAGDINYSVYGGSAGTGTSNYGTYGICIGAGTTNYGAYGTASGASTNWAGYFGDGNVMVENRLHLKVDSEPSLATDNVILYVKDRAGAGTADLYAKNEEGNEYLLTQSSSATQAESNITSITSYTVDATGYSLLTFNLAAAADTVSTINGGSAGKIITLVNGAGYDVTLLENGDIWSGGLILSYQDAATLVYSAVESKWVISGNREN